MEFNALRKQTMGEASRSKKAIIAASTRCIYCEGVPTTVEHMPPRSMFKNKDRPSGMEFGCCKQCNEGTRHIDLLAALMCRFQISRADQNLEKEVFELHRMLMTHFPKVGNALFEDTVRRDILVSTPGGILVRKVELNINSELIKRSLAAFAAKLSMALFKVHTGKELSMSGAIETNYFLNAGITRETEEIFLNFLPRYGNLSQGIKTTDGEFGYRFNTDNNELLSFIAKFHSGLTVFAIISSNVEKYPVPFGFPNSMHIRPSELLELASF